MAKTYENYEYGEGTMRCNKALNYLIAQARYAKRKWNLTDQGLSDVLFRLRNAESPESRVSLPAFPTKRVLKPEDDNHGV